MTGYIEIELGGEIRQVKFGNFALLTLEAMQQAEAAKNGGKTALEGAAAEDPASVLSAFANMVYAGIINQDRIKARPDSVTLDQVREWVYDDFDITQIEAVMECFNSSKALGRLGKLVNTAKEAHIAALPKEVKKK